MEVTQYIYNKVQSKTSLLDKLICESKHITDLSAMLLKQGHQYRNFCKAFFNFYRRPQRVDC